MEIGEVIKFKRMSLKMSQKKLADILGVNPMNMSCWESCKSCPSSRTLLKIMNILDLQRDDFMNVGLFEKPKKNTTEDTPVV